MNRPRNVAVFLVRLPRGKRVRAIGRQFGADKCSSAHSATKKTKREISEDRRLRNRVKYLEEMSTNSHQRT